MGMGGALYLNCINEKVGLQRDCNVSINGSNSFVDNFASNDGGAILWVSNQIFTD